MPGARKQPGAARAQRPLPPVDGAGDDQKRDGDRGQDHRGAARHLRHHRHDHEQPEEPDAAQERGGIEGRDRSSGWMGAPWWDPKPAWRCAGSGIRPRPSSPSRLSKRRARGCRRPATQGHRPSVHSGDGRLRPRPPADQAPPDIREDAPAAPGGEKSEEPGDHAVRRGRKRRVVILVGARGRAARRGRGSPLRGARAGWSAAASACCCAESRASRSMSMRAASPRRATSASGLVRRLSTAPSRVLPVAFASDSSVATSRLSSSTAPPRRCAYCWANSGPCAASPPPSSPRARPRVRKTRNTASPRRDGRCRRARRRRQFQNPSANQAGSVSKPAAPSVHPKASRPPLRVPGQRRDRRCPSPPAGPAVPRRR